MKSHLYSAASAATVLGILPTWILFCWSQRAWMAPVWTLAGGPAILVVAIALGGVAWRRHEPLGWLATLMAAVLPAAVFVYFNFVGNP